MRTLYELDMPGTYKMDVVRGPYVYTVSAVKSAGGEEFGECQMNCLRKKVIPFKNNRFTCKDEITTADDVKFAKETFDPNSTFGWN